MAMLKKPKSGHTNKPPRPNSAAPDPLAHLLLSRYIAAYCEWLKVKHSSPATLRTRAIALRTFTSWAHERSLDDPREITKPVLDRYQRHLFYYRKADGQPLAIRSQVTMLQALRSFFKWTTRENHTLFNPASELELPRIPKLLPRSILTVEEVAAILNETDIDSVYGLRDRAMLELLYSTALRRQEVANLIYSDIDFKRQVVFVRGGKGGHDRVAPIGERACAWLEKYLADAREQLATVQTNALFLTDYGDPVSGYYVTARVKRYMALAGIERVGAAHLLRHACATHMLEGGADIRFIQALLGHANLNTTEIYTHVSIEKLKAIHAATHPARITRLQGAAKAQGQVAAPDPATALLAALQAESSEEESDGAPT